MWKVCILAAMTAPSLVLASCAHGTFLHPREEGKVEVKTFGYSGAIGPSNWLQLDPTANSACAMGTRQSPIDMISSVFPLISGADLGIQLSSFEEGAEFENLGTTVEIVAEDETGSMTVPGSGKFKLQQFHFHLPSEHLDDGKSMPMEMHMVWENESGHIAVFGIYIQVAEAGEVGTTSAAVVATAPKKRSHAKMLNGKRQEQAAVTEPTAMLETIFASLDSISEPGTVTKTAKIDMTELQTLLQAASFQSYSGSLTTPPCTEGVSWFVSTQKLAVTASTLAKARSVLGFNARFPQNELGQPNALHLSSQNKESVATTTTTSGVKILNAAKD